MKNPLYFSLLVFLVVFPTENVHAADKEQLKETVATIINLNGFLCAKVVDIRPLDVGPDIYEVTCIEYRGGSGRKIYILNAAEGRAWVP